jgi:hypothetical protein
LARRGLESKTKGRGRKGKLRKKEGSRGRKKQRKKGEKGMREGNERKRRRG